MLMKHLRGLGLIFSLWGLLLFSGMMNCSTGGGLSIEITADSNTVFPDETLQLTVTARDASGSEISGLTFEFIVSIPRYATVDSAAVVTALYPGTVEITASADGTTSAPFTLNINFPENSQTVTQITDNGQTDDWGPNNAWKIITGRNLLFLNDDGINHNVLIYNLDDPLGSFTNLNSSNQDTDFLAIGSGATAGEFMAAYRLGLTDTMVNDNGAATSDLGAVNQEENSIDQGCLFFREGGAANDIQLFEFDTGLMELASTNELRDPIGSECQAVWSERPGDGTSNLIFYDGNSETTVATGLALFPQFDFSLGQLVYTDEGDLFHVDLTTNPATTTQITSDGVTFIDQRPKTDGNSIVWIQEEPAVNDWRVFLYNIAEGTSTLISTNTNEKILFNGPAIHLGQVAWLDSLPEGLFFYPGSGGASSTIEVPQNGNNLDQTFAPYLENGVLTWVASDGDNEVFVME